MKEIIKILIAGTITMIICVLSMMFALNIQRDISTNFTNYCNKEYGENNWDIITADRGNMTLKNKYYIGNIWTCVPISKLGEDEE